MFFFNRGCSGVESDAVDVSGDELVGEQMNGNRSFSPFDSSNKSVHIVQHLRCCIFFCERSVRGLFFYVCRFF